MDDIEEEGQYSTVPTLHPNVQMHLEEMDDQRLAAMLKRLRILSLRPPVRLLEGYYAYPS